MKFIYINLHIIDLLVLYLGWNGGQGKKCEQEEPNKVK